MKKITLLIVLFVLLIVKINAQEYIKTSQVYSKQMNFDFTNEWQYVSTDLYLFNAQKIKNLINVHLGKKKKKGKLGKKNPPDINNIMITAQLEGMGSLDELVYPIFNFVVSTTDNGDYQLQVSDPGVIQIVDNAPVSSIKDYIGAKLNVQVFTKKNKTQAYLFLAKQLEKASTFSVSNAKQMALDIVGEIGKMMQKDAVGQQYQFQSTIRFYEEQNFDKQIHSITIYILQPSYYNSVRFDTTNISKNLDTLSNIIFDKAKLRKLINYNVYPYLVAVNYRSKYKPEISDEIDFEMLKARTVTNESNYTNGAISKDIYHQEKSLIDFLNIFAQLQLDVNNYELNYKAKITDDYTIQLFIIMQDYWKLKNTFGTILKTYTNNPLFDNEFKSLYEHYLTKATLLFESNSALRDVREHIETIFTIENSGTKNLDSAQYENYIRKLRLVEIPKREQNSSEATITKHHITTLESNLYKYQYKPHLSKFSGMPVNSKTNSKIQTFTVATSPSYCELCKTGIHEFTVNFAMKYENYLYNQAKTDLKELNGKMKFKILEYSKTHNCIKSKIDSTNTSIDDEYRKILTETLNKTNEKKTKLYQLIYTQQKMTSHEEIIEHINSINNLSNEIETNYKSICTVNPELCNCKN